MPLTRLRASRPSGIWFYKQEDCDAVTALLNKVLANYKHYESPDACAKTAPTAAPCGPLRPIRCPRRAPSPSCACGVRLGNVRNKRRVPPLDVSANLTIDFSLFLFTPPLAQ